MPFEHLSKEERVLRRKLRAHGRQIGDVLHNDKTQELDRLIEEVAYEHWHRMLFARFLAENNLLMYPDPDEPVAITLEECNDLAADEGSANGWELAARFAARMLPQIFHPDSPVFQLTLPPEYQQQLEQLVAKLPQEVLHASDSLGWVYQYWQTDNKERINQSEVKIDARELPAVTQLFTEPYMVGFLLDNTLGAWWAGKRLTEDDLHNASCEEELRQKAAIPGVPLTYLRFVQMESGAWTPAAGTFDAWPQNLSQFKLLDPCCGSGHFLVAALYMLVPMRMKLDGLSAKEAVHAVLRDNLHGLELDQRCVKLAAFSLAFAVWTYRIPGTSTMSSRFAGSDCTGTGTFGSSPLGYMSLPELNVACSGLPVTADKAQWTALAKPHTKLRNALDLLYDEFQKAPILGSLLSPSEGIAASIAHTDMSSLLQEALADKDGEQYSERHEAAVMAQGLAKAVALLAEHYSLVITNVPYLARRRQADGLRDFCETYYPEAKNDLATVFLERCLNLCVEGGTAAIVLPQNWLFLSTYKKFREKLLTRDTWHLLARLGSDAFETISGEVVKAILLVISHGGTCLSGGLLGNRTPAHILRGLDVSSVSTAPAKADALRAAPIQSLVQAKQLENPDARVGLETTSGISFLNKYAEGLVGLQTGDDPMFLMAFWETECMDHTTWEFLQGTPSIFTTYAGQSWVVRWEQKDGLLFSTPSACPTKGLKALGKPGIAMHRMGQLFPYLYSKERFHQNVAVIVPHNPAHLPAIWCFCSSPEYKEAVQRIDQSLKVTNTTLVTVPFNLERWQKVADENYPHGLPGPYSDDPTQWIFHGHPCGSVIWDENTKKTVKGSLRTDASVLQVAVARLLGYRWPAELDTSMELTEEQWAWVKRCEDLQSFADADGIVCLPPVRGEASASERLLNLLAAAYGDAWSNDILAALLSNAHQAGKTLEIWLREKFFAQHCKLFRNRPFIWHIWDGLRDGFAALVNYHKFDHKNLETLIYTYLGDWISRQKQDIATGIDGAQERLNAAEVLKKRLELILEGEAPYDIFVRWKPLAQQPLGWEPDIEDGVRLNIRPFLSVPDVGKKGAGILHDKPNINWNKDRGKDEESSPWYHLFNGDRINDYHLTLAEKRAAREVAE